MATRPTHSIEVFSAGCPLCEEAIQLVRRIAGPAGDLTIHDLRTDPTAQERARQLGIHRVPAVVINGRLAQCCRSGPVDPVVIRSRLERRT
jgi:glutaredoxin